MLLEEFKIFVRNNAQGFKLIKFEKCIVDDCNRDANYNYKSLTMGVMTGKFSGINICSTHYRKFIGEWKWNYDTKIEKKKRS